MQCSSRCQVLVLKYASECKPDSALLNVTTQSVFPDHRNCSSCRHELRQFQPCLHALQAIGEADGLEPPLSTTAAQEAEKKQLQKLCDTQCRSRPYITTPARTQETDTPAINSEASTGPDVW